MDVGHFVADEHHVAGLSQSAQRVGDAAAADRDVVDAAQIGEALEGIARQLLGAVLLLLAFHRRRHLAGGEAPAQDRAKSALALLMADEIVHAADHQDLPALGPQEAAHQFARHPAGHPVVAADIGDAAAGRQVAGDGHDRDGLADGLQGRRDARVIVAQDHQPIRLFRGAVDRACHCRRLQTVEIMQQAHDALRFIGALGVLERGLQAAVIGVAGVLDQDRDA